MVADRIAFDLLPSTQDEAVRRVREGAAPGLTVVARRQHRGRGRLDHGWVSPLGGLYLSTVVGEPPFAPGLFPLGVGASLSRSLDRKFGVVTAMKWPNDLLVASPGRPARKLAGILVDRVLSPRFGVALVVGIGLNAACERAEFPADLSERVAVLSELCDRKVEPPEVEPIVLEAVGATARRLRSSEGRRELWEESRRLLYGLGRAVRIDGRPGGVIRGLDEDGALLVDHDGELLTVHAGDVVVEGSA